jgi:hypothetical protein
MTHYVKDKDILFIHIPKTGGTSISKWLSNFCNGERLGPKHGDLFDWQTKNHVPQFVFTTVRNPYARLLSYFFYAGEQIKERINKDKWANKYNQEMIDTYNLGFSNSLNVNNYYPDVIMKNQVDYFDISSINYMLRTENLKQDFQQIQQWLCCYEPLPILNKGKEVDYRDYYTSKDRKFIEKHFEKDLDILKYTF